MALSEFSTGVMPQVVVLCGGLGTRLGNVTNTTPKSLVKVAGKAILTHILDWASKQGCSRALLLTGHLGERFEDFTHPDLELRFLREDVPLGTGGALWNGRFLLEERFILLWGDDLHQISYKDLLESHFANGCPITMTVTTCHDSNNLEFIGERVVRYDKRLSNPKGLNGIEAGTSGVERSVVLSHGREGFWSWEEEVYPSLSGFIAAHLDDSGFWDSGTPEGLDELDKFLQDG